MSNRYYQSDNCAETINKEFSMAEDLLPNENCNAINNFSYKKDELQFENRLTEYPLREPGEKCGEIFFLSCSGDFAYRCQLCEAYFFEIGTFFCHSFNQHGYKDNMPPDILEKQFKKNRIITITEKHENDGDLEIMEITNENNVNYHPVKDNGSLSKSFTSNLPKLVQTQGTSKYILVSPVVDSNYSHEQPEAMHFQQPTQHNFGLVTPHFTNNFAPIPQNQEYIYNSPIHTGVQTRFVNTPSHNVQTNIVTDGSPDRIQEELSSFDNLIEFDNGSNSSQSATNALHKEVGNTIEEIVANYPDEDNVMPPTTAEQFVIATEETSNQCAQSFQEQENGNPDIINGNKIEALIEELVNSNSNSQQNYVSEHDNNSNPIVLSGNHPQTLYVQNPAFFSTNVQNNSDANLVNQHILSHQPVLLNDDGVHQNYIFDGQQLQPTNFANTSNSQNQTPNLFLKFNENDGNIYLLNGFNNNLNINGIIDSNSQIQIASQNEIVSESVVSDEINITEEVLESKEITLENSISNRSCERIAHNFINDSPNAQKLLHGNLDNINKLDNSLEDQMIVTDNNIDLHNIQMQHVSAEEIVGGTSIQLHEQSNFNMQSDVDMLVSENSPGAILLRTNEVDAMDVTIEDSHPIMNTSRETIQKDQNKHFRDFYSMKRNNEPKFLDNFQKFLENKREQTLITEDDIEDEPEENAIKFGEKQNIRGMTDNNDTVIKNFICKICERAFKEEFHLKLHNDRSKQFKCEECNLLFCSLKIYNKHVKLHVNNDETPVIKCDLCSLTFRSQHFLEMHMKNHNGKYKN